RGQLQQAGCGRAIFSASASFCGSIHASLSRMDKNLDELKRTRVKAGGGSNTRQERARIRAALDANNCRDTVKPTVPSSATPASTERKVKERGTRSAAPTQASGNLRTMCVRTCDGYYFPISWSVSQRAFERDQHLCA